MEKNKKIESINKEDLNSVIKTSKLLLKVMLIIFIIVGVYAGLMVFKELKIGEIILSLLKILIPLFIGIVIAWILNPLINFMKEKGMRRGFGVFLAYFLLFVVIGLIISALIPLLYNQIIELIDSLPIIASKANTLLDSVFDKLSSGPIDTIALKDEAINKINDFSSNLYTTLPSALISFLSSMISGIGTFLVGLVIGFFLLMSWDQVDISLIDFIPNKYRENIKELFISINSSLRSYVNGALIDALVVFLVSSLAFFIIGLKSPLLFGIFCGITNVIPYVGPYIGGAPAVIVGFSQSPAIGIATLIAVFIIQMIEGNVLQTLIISKATKLHPVTIIIGLLVFGHFFGIVGMLLSTPIIGVLKVIFQFFEKKYGKTISENE